MKSQASHLETLRDIISEHLGVDEAHITPDSNLFDELGADSLDAVEIVMAIEEEYDIEIPDDIAETFTTVGKIIEHLESIQEGH